MKNRINTVGMTVLMSNTENFKTSDTARNSDREELQEGLYTKKVNNPK
jgi:hypothetical protein